MQDYTDISFFVNLDPFDKKNSKNNGVLKLVQKSGLDSTVVTSEVNSSIDILHNIISFALSKEIKIPQWMSDFSAWAINLYDYRNTFEIKLLQLIPSNVIDIVTLISILESVAFESKCTIGGVESSFFSHYINFLRISNSNLYFKYRDWVNDNVFSVFTIKSFEIANFILLEDDATGNIYAVYDNLKIEGVSLGQKIVSRIVLNGANYIFTGGFVILYDNKYILRLPSYDNINQISNLFLNDEFFKNKSVTEYEVLFAYNNCESDLDEFNMYFRELNYEDALIDLIYEILSVEPNFDTSVLNEIFSKRSGFKTKLKEFEKTICAKIVDPTKKIFVYNLFKFCRISHPQNNAQKYGGIKGDSFEFLSTLFEEKKIGSKANTRKRISIKNHPLYRMEDPVKGYNLGVELLTKGNDLDFALSAITNSYIINDKLSPEMLAKWYCSVGLALKSFGEIDLAKKYLENANKLGIDTTIIINNLESLSSKHLKLAGRINRFGLISFNGLLKDKFISNKGIILAYKILEYIAKDKQAEKLEMKSLKPETGIEKMYEKINVLDKFPLKKNETINSVYKDIDLVYELLIQARLIENDPSGIPRLTALGKIYFYNKNITELLEFLLFTFIRTANFELLFKNLGNSIQKKILSKTQKNIYLILSEIYSNGSLQISSTDLVTKIQDYGSFVNPKTRKPKVGSELKVITKNSTEFVYGGSIFYFFELFGIIQQEVQTDSPNNYSKLLRISDEGIYFMGNIELQVDKIIPVILRKILN